MAISQVALINTFVNRVDAWAFHQPWARSGTRVWGEHLRLGWEWDEDAFTTNMFAHPYHGGLYFNAARSNGVDFFQSVPYAIMGSWTWEYFGEKYRPSLNDWFMTSFGGITLGEMFHRVSSTIRDNRARGRGRTLRELAALPMDPIGGLNRLLRGQWKGNGPNPPEHDPGEYVLRVGTGLRFARLISDSGVATMGALVVDLLYGDQFGRPYETPFDVFNVRLILSTNGGINMLRGSGRLYGANLNSSTARIRHVLAINQRYDYVKNPAHSIGGQSVEIGVNSRWRVGSGGYGLRTALFLDGILMGAIDAPGTGLGARTYDFGPGVGARWEIAVERHEGARFLRIFGQGEYIHAVSGASADHVVDVSGIELTIPIMRGFGIAGHTYVFNRRSRYSDRPRDSRDYPEARLLLVWTKAGFKP